MMNFKIIMILIFSFFYLFLTDFKYLNMCSLTILIIEYNAFTVNNYYIFPSYNIYLEPTKYFHLKLNIHHDNT